MVKKLCLLALITFVSFRLSAEGISAGFLDLSSYRFETEGAISLEGDWEFYPGIKVSGFDSGNGFLVKVPGNWGTYTVDGKALENYGTGTFRLRIARPKDQRLFALRIPAQGHSFRVYANGRKLAVSGVAEEKDAGYRPSDRPATVFFAEDAEVIELIVQIANFSHARGGFRYAMTLGTPEQISEEHTVKIAFDLFLTGALLAIFIYHLAIYFMRRQDIASLYFALFCLAMLVYTVDQGERFIYTLFPRIPWDIKKKSDYIPYFGAIPFLILYVNAVFKNIVGKRLLAAIIAFSCAFAALVVCSPVSFFSRLTPYFEGLLMFLVFLVACTLIRLRKYQPSDCALFLFGFVMILVTAANDALSHNQVIKSMSLVPLGVFLFVCSQSLLLAKKFTESFRRTENLRNAYQRFVPEGFLKILDKESITAIRLGDHIEGEMTILFCDIRDFTSLSENMTPKENFDFINSFLKNIAGTITEHNGIIDKYIGDEIMALFPRSPADALDAALAMQRNLGQFNLDRAEGGLPPVAIGIGLHRGLMMLGTIGEHERMDFTVISDAVNTASRIEGLTKFFKAPILASAELLSSLETKERYFIRFLGKIRVKGKKRLVEVCEVSSNEPGSAAERRMKTAERFNAAIEAYLDGRFADAREGFQAVIGEDPDDEPARFYLRKCVEEQNSGTSEEWNGAVRYEE